MFGHNNSEFLHYIKAKKKWIRFRLHFTVILKESKRWEEKKEERNQDILWKKYLHAAYINMLIKQNDDYDYKPDFHSFRQLSKKMMKNNNKLTRFMIIVGKNFEQVFDLIQRSFPWP